MKAILLLSAILMVPLAFGNQRPDSDAGASPQVIEVTAKNYEFVPNEIRVKKGTHVELRLHTADRAHGLMLETYPEGVHPDGQPGLVFSKPQDKAKVEHDEVRTIDFVAARVGTYDFKCSVQCGLLGHGKMKGKLVVEE